MLDKHISSNSINFDFEKVYDIYLTNSLYSLYYIAFKKYVYSNCMPIRQCENCGKFFIVENRTDEIYCNNIFKDTGKTCKELSSNIAHKKKVQENPVVGIYLNLIKKKRMRKVRNKTEKATKEFEAWAAKAKIEYSKYKNNEITSKEFEKWLIENDK